MTQQEHESNVKNLQELIQENEESLEEKNNLIAEYRSQVSFCRRLKLLLETALADGCEITFR